MNRRTHPVFPCPAPAPAPAPAPVPAPTLALAVGTTNECFFSNIITSHHITPPCRSRVDDAHPAVGLHRGASREEMGGRRRLPLGVHQRLLGAAVPGPGTSRLTTLSREPIRIDVACGCGAQNKEGALSGGFFFAFIARL